MLFKEIYFEQNEKSIYKFYENWIFYFKTGVHIFIPLTFKNQKPNPEMEDTKKAVTIINNTTITEHNSNKIKTTIKKKKQL